MFVKVGSPKKDITNSRITPPRRFLLENLKVFLCLVMKFAAGILSTEAVQKCPNLLYWPPQRVFNASLPSITTRVLPAEIIFDHGIADNHIT
jgi:hypothetical protein